MPGAQTFHARHGADYMGAVCAIRRFGDAKLTILEKRPQSGAFEGARIGMSNRKRLVLPQGHELTPHKIRCCAAP